MSKKGHQTNDKEKRRHASKGRNDQHRGVEDRRNTHKISVERLEVSGKKSDQMIEESISDHLITSRRESARDTYGVSLSQRSGIGGTVKGKKGNTLIGTQQAKTLMMEKSP